MILYTFDAAFNYVIANETPKDNIHEVSNNPNDIGGTTKYGVSLRFLKSLSVEKLREYGIFVEEVTEQDITNLTVEQAKSIYKGEFWDHLPFDKINVDGIRNYIFDMAVNMGLAPAVKCAQRACWALGYYGALTDDGIMGHNTLYAISNVGTDLIYPLRAERANYYRMIVERNPAQSVFLEGWFNRTYR